MGLWLGIAFGLCFLTGLISHYAQLPATPSRSRPARAGATASPRGSTSPPGIAAIPLLLVKLWSVLPHLFEALPLR